MLLKSLSDSYNEIPKTFEIVKFDVKQISTTIGTTKNKVIELGNTYLEIGESINNVIKNTEKLGDGITKLCELTENYNKQVINEISELKTKNTTLETEISNIKSKDFRNKIKLASQDLNSRFNLEQTENKAFNKYMRNSRTNRNGDCHYIKNDDSDNIIQFKLRIIRNKLIYYKNIESKNKTYIEILINKLDSEIISSEPVIEDDDKEFFEQWWID